MIFNLILSKVLAVVQSVSADSLMNQIHENAEEFEEVDPVGFGLAAVGIVVVFASLLLLYFVFLNIAKAIQRISRRKRMKEGMSESASRDSEMTGEINAAIAAALYLYSQELHDQESAVLTINRVSRTYSPWSSKIYGLRQNPR